MPAAAATARIVSSVPRMIQREVRRSDAGRARRSDALPKVKADAARVAVPIARFDAESNQVPTPIMAWGRGLSPSRGEIGRQVWPIIESSQRLLGDFEEISRQAVTRFYARQLCANERLALVVKA